MSATPILPIFPVFTDIDGQPLESGYIWVGQPNLNPQTNPQQVYWDQGLTQSATQPIRTVGGYPSNVGTASQIFTNGSYSVRVTNKNGSVLYEDTVANVNDPLRADLATTGVGKGAEAVAFKQAGAGAGGVCISAA